MVRGPAFALLLTWLLGASATAGQQPTGPATSAAAAPPARAATSAPAAPPAASAVGSVCVLSHALPEQMPYRGGDALPPTRTYDIRLNGGPWVPLSTRTPVLLADIPRAGRHRVAIRGDGKPYTAFRFRFDAEDPDALCLYQNEMYQTWQLRWVRQSFKSCRCSGVAPSAWQSPPP